MIIFQNWASITKEYTNRIPSYSNMNGLKNEGIRNYNHVVTVIKTEKFAERQFLNSTVNWGFRVLKKSNLWSIQIRTSYFFLSMDKS